MLKKNYIFLSSKNHSVAIKVSETTWHIFPMLHFQANFFPIWEHSVRCDWQVHFEKIFVHVRGDNFLQERGGQCFWCWVGFWREPVMQRFDGML